MGECCAKESEPAGTVVGLELNAPPPRAKRTQSLAETQASIDVNIPATMERHIEINVGGRVFKTSKMTIATSGSPVLTRMLEQGKISEGKYFLDRDGYHFRHVLNFLRDGADNFCIPDNEVARDELHHEALSLGLDVLAKVLGRRATTEARPPPPSDASITEEVESLVPHQGAPLPSNEVERLHRLEELEILHTDRNEPRYNNITSIIAAVLQMPIALISLVHDEIQWFKASHGLQDCCSTDRKSSICAQTFIPEDPRQASMFVCEDCSLDAHLKHNPLVKGADHFRFYAGCPLVTSDGIRLGAICVIDREPNHISPMQAQILVNFATLVSQEIERANLASMVPKVREKIRGGAPPAEGDFAAGPLRRDRMQAALGEAILLVEARTDSILWPVMYANEAWNKATSIFVKSPLSLSEDVVATGSGLNVLECATEGMTSSNNPTLWDWLDLPVDDAIQLLQRLKEEWSQGSPRVFNVNATTKLAKREGGDSSSTTSTPVSVHCRFMPADMPLDINASVIRPVPAKDMNARYDTDNPPTGHLYFISISFDTSAPIPSDTAAQEEFPIWSTSENSTSESTANRQLRLLGQPNNEALGKPFMKSAVDSLKPPVSPFFDVSLVRAIAEGAFGKVYFALWYGSPVAVKVLQEINKKKPTSRKQRRTGQKKEGAKDDDPTVEAALSVCISHPNLVQTFKHSTRSLGENDEATETWIVQEWCEGGTLGDYIQNCPIPFDFMDILDICMDITSAGIYLHSRRIIHADLSPNNVLLKGNVSSKKFVCKLCDFGRAKVLEGEIEGIKSGKIGTLTHMPPESLDKDAVLTTKVDVWSFGILLWQIFTRKKPYQGYAWAHVVHEVGLGNCPKFPERDNHQLKSLYEACTKKEPEVRLSFQDVSERLHALQNECIAMIAKDTAMT